MKIYGAFGNFLKYYGQGNGPECSDVCTIPSQQQCTWFLEISSSLSLCLLGKKNHPKSSKSTGIMIPATSTPQQPADFMDTVSAWSWSRCTACKKQRFSNVILDVCFSFFSGYLFCQLLLHRCFNIVCWEQHVCSNYCCRNHLRFPQRHCVIQVDLKKWSLRL